MSFWWYLGISLGLWKWGLCGRGLGIDVYVDLVLEEVCVIVGMQLAQP